MKNIVLLCAFTTLIIFNNQAQNPFTYGEFSGNSLEAMAAGTLSQNGYMFTLKAKDSVAISGVTAPFEPGFSWLYIFKKMGSIQGFETDTNAWTKVDSVYATNYGENYITFTFKQKDIVKSGEQISYYLHSKNPSQAYIRYNQGTAPNALQTQNDDLILYQGAGVLGYFQQAFTGRKFAGSILYTKAARFSCDTLNSFSNGTSTVKGFMFNIEAKDKHIELNQLYTKMKVVDSCANLHIYTKPGTYQGFESDSGSWTLFATQKVCMTDTSFAQAIASNLNLVIAAGSSMAFHVVFDDKNPRANFIQFTENPTNDLSFENELVEVSALKGLSDLFTDNATSYYLNGYLGLCEKQYQGLQEQNEKAFIVYPNPSSESIQIYSTVNWENLQIIDSQGRAALFHHKNEGDKINISSLKSGLYFIKINKSSVKFIKL